MKKLLLLFLGTILFIPIESFAENQWIQKASFGGAARHRCTGFSVGNKGYIGGGHINSGISVYHEDYWQYDPDSDTWTQIADFGGGKRYHSTAFSIGEFAYVGCGEDDNDTYHNDFYRYVPQYNIWQPIASLPGNPRRGATSFVIDEMGYVGTGQSDFGYEEDFYRYDPALNQWFAISDFLGEARSSAVGFSNNGRGYVGTGHIWGDDTKDFFEYEPLTDTWTQKSDVGPIFRQDATGFVLDGKGYIGTGNDVTGDINYKDFWEYDFQSDTWTQIGDFCGQGRRYMVSFVIGQNAYAGTGTDGTNLRDFYMFNPLLSVDTEHMIEFEIYPNPSTELITLQVDDVVLLEIFSMTGELVYSNIVSDSKKTISKHEIGTGTFIARMSNESGSSTQKLVFE